MPILVNLYRIKMALSLSGTTDQGIQSQSLFPLYVFLARLDSEASGEEVNCFNVTSNNTISTF